MKEGLKSCRKPCPACPFRKESLNGWLGASTPEQFLATAVSNTPMPCHLSVNYERDDWRERANAAPQCVGRAIFLANTEATAIFPGVMPVESSDEVFGLGSEFLAHHRQSPMKTKTPSKKTAKVAKPKIDYGKLPKDRIAAEVHKLKIIKPRVLAMSRFGSDHHAAIDLQIKMLEGTYTIDNAYDDYGESEDGEMVLNMIDAAEDARRFMDDPKQSSLVHGDGWESLIQ